MKLTKILSNLLLINLFFYSSPVLTTTFYKWIKIDNANYYQGTIVREDGQSINFRTQNTKLIFPENSKISINAYSKSGAKLESNLPIEIISSSKETKEPPNEETSLVETEKPLVPAPEPESLHEPLANYDVSLFQGLGLESLSSSGGASSFSGSSMIADVNFKGIMDLAKLPWSISVDIKYHKFNAEFEEKVASISGSSVNKSQSYRRLYFAINVLHLWSILDGPHKLFWQIGVSSWNGPVLVISDTTNGEASFAQKSAYAVNLSTKYFYILNKKQRIELLATLIPIGFGNGITITSTRLIKLYSSWRYIFWRDVYLNTGLLIRYDSIGAKVTCPAEASNCKENSISSFTSFALKGGVGYSF